MSNDIAMLKSMTGFGRAQASVEGFNITAEIKSVNHRYFEFSARIPRTHQYLEEKLKSFCQSRVARGKIELYVTVEDVENGNTLIDINADYCKAYIDALNRLSIDYGLKWKEL